MDFLQLSNKFHEFASSDPVQRTWMGLHDCDGELPDPSLGFIQKRVSQAKDLLVDFESFCPGNFGEELDVDLAKLYLSHFIFLNTYKVDGLTQNEQMPEVGDVLGNALLPLFVRDERLPKERLDLISSRIEKIPEYLEGYIKRISKPVSRWVAIELEAVAGLSGLFDNIISWAKSENYDTGRLEEVSHLAEEALNNYVKKLKLLPVKEEFSIGEAVAQKLVSLIGIDLSLSELYEMAKNFLHSNHVEIEKIRSDLTKKYGLLSTASVEEVDKVIKKKFHVPFEGVIKRYRAEQERVMSFIHEKKLFVIPDNQKMVIEQTPTFLIPTIPIGAMFPPPPFNKPFTSIIYATITEDRLSDQNALSITNTMLHEGIPGHHLQFASCYLNSSLIRKHIDANEHAEGWTTTMEEYMIDVGYVNDDVASEVRFIVKRELARLGARVAIDLYFMTGDKGYLNVGFNLDFSSSDPFENASKLLRFVTGFTESRAQGELNWYSQRRAYPLCYLTGNQIIKKMKADMKIKVGGTLSGLDFDRKFHEVYLTSGNMPLSFLRKVFIHQGLI